MVVKTRARPRGAPWAMRAGLRHLAAGLAGLGLGCAVPVMGAAQALSPTVNRTPTVMTTPTVNHFTPKTVKPPTPGQTRFLTIQIDPEEQRQALRQQALKPFTAVTPEAQGAGPRAPAHYAWFWDKVTPALGDRAGRFDKAVAVLSQGPNGQSVRSPRLADLQRIADAHGNEILKATIGTEVSPALVVAMISTESAGRHDAVSHAGAVGLMQLIPATAARFDVKDSRDPEQNIKGGVSYLDWLMKEFDRDPLMVIAAYNAGEGAVRRNAGVPDYAETRDYVPKVLAAWTVARGLCLTPPQLVSDGCVFTRRTQTAQN